MFFYITVAANALRSQVQSVCLVNAVRKKNVDIMENVNRYLENLGIGKLFLLNILNFQFTVTEKTVSTPST